MAKVRGHSARVSLLFTGNRIVCTLLPKGGSLMRPMTITNSSTAARDFRLEDQRNQRRGDQERNGAARRSVASTFDRDASGGGNCWRLFPQCLRGHSPREQGRYLQKGGNYCSSPSCSALTGVSVPNRPSLSSLMPALKNRVVAGPAPAPLPKVSDHRP